LKEVLLGQFEKRKWQYYFELLRLPMEMQCLKPSVLMGKLKPSSIFLSVSAQTTTFFWQVFDLPATFHAGSGLCRKPQVSRGYG
jgi:hypothetical protein